MAVDADTASRELMESTTSLIGDDGSLAASTVEWGTSDDEDVDGPEASGTPLALAVGVIMVVGLAALTGWLGFRTYQSHQADAQRSLFLEVGRQGALNLTTISYTEAEADVARILNSATGTFTTTSKSVRSLSSTWSSRRSRRLKVPSPQQVWSRSTVTRHRCSSRCR